MNTLGKILVFFVLILSLIWNYLVVNAYATRTNYKAELENTRKLYAEAAKAAAASQKQLEEVKSASDAVVAQHVATIRGLEGQLKTAQDSHTQLSGVIGKEVSDRIGKLQTASLQASDIRAKDGQIGVLQSRNTELNIQVNAATIAEQKANNEKLSANIARDAAQRKSEKTEKDLQDLSELLENSRNGGGTGGVGATRIPPTDPDFRATVSAADGTLIEINQGSNSKLQKGAVVDISRPDANKYLGKLVIERIDPFSATGRFVPLASVTKPAADDMPRKGDVVSVIK